MRHIDSSEARRSFSRLYHEVAYGGERVVVENHGKPLVALVPIADLDRLQDAERGDSPRAAPKREACLAVLRRERPLLEKAGIRRAALFGSVARDQAGPNSDVDVLVELDPDAHVDLLQFAGIQLRLLDLFGRNVDLVSRGALNPDHDALIIDEAVYAF